MPGDTERYQMQGDAQALLYERYLVPAIASIWAADLVERGAPKTGERVLDVSREPKCWRRNNRPSQPLERANWLNDWTRRSVTRCLADCFTLAVGPSFKAGRPLSQRAFPAVPRAAIKSARTPCLFRWSPSL